MRRCATTVTVKRADELQRGDHIIDVLFGVPRIALVADSAIVGDDVNLTLYGLASDALYTTTSVGNEFHVVTTI